MSEPARIGEILVQSGVVAAEGRERALRSQAVHGGRLGTNLIEQFALGLDELADGLARHHDMPAALDRHFATGDQAVQAMLSPETAGRLRAVPLGRLPGEGGVERVAVAFMDPPDDDALAELSGELRREVVAAIAPELRVLYHLERLYGIARANRFKRGARRSQMQGVVSHERRGYVRTLAEVDPDPPESSLARIEVRRMERSRTGEIETLSDLTVLGDALVAVKRATGRQRVGELLVGAFEQGFDGVFSAALILTVRAGLLFGWRGFARGRDSTAMERVSAVAVPLLAESMFGAPCRTGRPYFGPPPGGGSETDRRLWRFLGTGVPAAIGVQPVQVFGELATVLYVQAQCPIPASGPPAVAELARSMCTALERLVHTDDAR